MKKIHVGFLLSYDYDKLRYSIPPVYDEADEIFLAIDKETRTWSGEKFDINAEFFDWIKEIDVDHKITIYRDDFYVPELSAIENDSRERQMLSQKMGMGNWLVQIDADEIFIDFKKFVKDLKKHDRYLDRPERNPIQIAGYLINIYKYLPDGLLYVNQPTKVMLATNYPNYKVARKTKERIIYTDNVLLHECLSRTEEELRFKFSNWGHNNEINESFFDKWRSATKENYKELKDLFYLNPKAWKQLGYLPTKEVDALKDHIALDPNLKVGKIHLLAKNFGQWFKHLPAFKPKADGKAGLPFIDTALEERIAAGRIKIVHVSGAKGWGGNERQIVNLIPAMMGLGVENIVLGIKDSLLEKECLVQNIEFVRVDGDKLSKWANCVLLKSVINEVRPDIIHLHTSDSLTFFTIADLLFNFKTKTVFSKKGTGASSSFISKLKYNYSGIDSIFCVSGSVERDFHNVLSSKNRAKTTVIHDCVSLDLLNVKETVNLREKYSIGKDIHIIGNIANHSRAKDLDTLVNVVDYLVHNLGRKDVVFVQIGEFTKLTDDLIKTVREKKLQQYIIFTDKIENAAGLNRQFDVFLMTSEREGGPTSVLEAMLIGVPIVSTKVGLVPDVIADGVNGYISEVMDYRNMAEKINLLLDGDTRDLSYIKLNSDKIAKEFSASFIAGETVAEYQKIRAR